MPNRQQTHTILGSRSQRGLTQLSLDVIFRSLGHNVVDCSTDPTLEYTINVSDSSEAAVFSASAFLDSVYADPAPIRASSRAPTPMLVGSSTSSTSFPPQAQEQDYPSTEGDALDGGAAPQLQSISPWTVRVVCREDSAAPPSPSWFGPLGLLPAGRNGFGQVPSCQGGGDTCSAKTLRDGR